VRRRLLAWYKTHGRDFAWRHTKDPYQLLMAEMMVQRTRAAQAERVWKDFVARYPTVGAANRASDEELAVCLRPLGLRWRIANITGAVRILAVGEKVSAPSLAVLRGVGHYAANSVAAIAEGARDPVVDTNVVRIYCRFFGIPISDRMRRASEFHALVRSMIPHSDPASFSWALLDFGGLVCTARHPACDACALSVRCATFADGGRRDTV
jgi:A/G-specific adenine glycosylase